MQHKGCAYDISKRLQMLCVCMTATPGRKADPLAHLTDFCGLQKRSPLQPAAALDDAKACTMDKLPSRLPWPNKKTNQLGMPSGTADVEWTFALCALGQVTAVDNTKRRTDAMRPLVVEGQTACNADSHSIYLQFTVKCHIQLCSLRACQHVMTLTCIK